MYKNNVWSLVKKKKKACSSQYILECTCRFSDKFGFLVIFSDSQLHNPSEEKTSVFSSRWKVCGLNLLKIRGRAPKNSFLVRYLCKSTFTWGQLSGVRANEINVVCATPLQKKLQFFLQDEKYVGRFPCQKFSFLFPLHGFSLSFPTLYICIPLLLNSKTRFPSEALTWSFPPLGDLGH